MYIDFPPGAPEVSHSSGGEVELWGLPWKKHWGGLPFKAPVTQMKGFQSEGLGESNTSGVLIAGQGPRHGLNSN